MCTISHDLKAIYIHIPKNGGSYINNVLINFYNFTNLTSFCRKDHDAFNKFSDKPNRNNEKLGFVNIREKGIVNYLIGSEEYLKQANLTLEQWNSYYKFTFIRNPYDKIISAYHFINKIYSRKPSFKDFLKDKDNCENWTYSHAFITQYDHLLDCNDKLNIDYLGDFNNLNEELIKVLTTLGVKNILHGKLIAENIKINASDVIKNYYNYFDEETLVLVNEYFHKDFEYLNFKKCNSMDELLIECQSYYEKRDNSLKKSKTLASFLNNELLDEEKKQLIEKLINKQNTVDKSSFHFFVENLKTLDKKFNVEEGFIYKQFIECLKKIGKKPKTEETVNTDETTKTEETVSSEENTNELPNNTQI